MDPQNNQNQGQDNGARNMSGKTMDNSTIMAVLCYLGPLVIVSYFTSKDNAFVKFHIKQGLVVFGIEVIVWILSSMLWSMWMILNLVNLATLVLSIIGIVNAVQGQQKELPLVGSFAKSFNF